MAYLLCGLGSISRRVFLRARHEDAQLHSVTETIEDDPEVRIATCGRFFTARQVEVRRSRAPSPEAQDTQESGSDSGDLDSWSEGSQ